MTPLTLRKPLRLLSALLCCSLWAPLSIATAQENAIGIIKTANDHAFILREHERIHCQIGDEVFQDDVLETDSTGSLGLTLKDNTRLSLGPSSRLSLKEFVFIPKEKEYSFIVEIIRGTLIYISGIMARLSPESILINTPTATVGVRGTRFAIRIDNGEVSTDKNPNREESIQ